MKKILIVGPAWVGDMMMAQCLFKLLKKRDPDIVLDVLAPAWSEPLLARMPEVNQSITMPFKHGQLQLGKRYRLGKKLRAAAYEQAIILPNSFKSALIPFFAAIPKRTGWSREMRLLLLNDVRHLDKKKYPLMIERFMALGIDKNETLSTPYPLPELFISPELKKNVVEKYSLTTKIRPILALCPGAEFGPAKRWPENYYAEVANAKCDEGWSVWLFGSANDLPVTKKIMALTQERCINLTSKTTLSEAVDLLSVVDAVIANDSGLMHIAAALQKPLIAIYGPTSAAFTPPLHSGARLLSVALPCQPCFQRECPLQHHRCMLDLTPDHILKMLSEMDIPCVS